jgi:hypothetical protein
VLAHERGQVDGLNFYPRIVRFLDERLRDYAISTPKNSSVMSPLYGGMKETPRRTTVTSSLNKIFTEQLGKIAPNPFYSRLLDRYLKTT